MHKYVIRKEIELLFVILIIAILAVLQLKAYLPARVSAKTVHSAGGASFHYARIDDIYYHAFHGEWPENNDQVIQFGFTDEYTKYGIFDDVQIKDGAVNLHYEKLFDGKTITLRPAVPAGDKFGPVIWVIGSDRQGSGWHVFGEDHTDVDNKYISSFAR
jgi:type II secretory pathway pseudopilin PulG